MKPTPRFPVVVLSFVLGGCKGDVQAIPQCDAALEEVDSACRAEGLSDVAKRTCGSAKKSIASLAEIGKKTGKIETAADGCKKQLDIIQKMVARRDGSGSGSKRQDATKAGGDEAGADESGGLGPHCEKVIAEVDAACGDLEQPSPTQKALCGASQKVAETYRKLSVNNERASETACEKTLDDWAKKGGLSEMVAGSKK